MAAKGNESKIKLFTKLQEMFPEAFWEDENKILRIPMDENGARVEIKVTLTAAKTNLGEGIAASAFSPASEISNVVPAMPEPTVEITQEEKDNVMNLINALGL